MTMDSSKLYIALSNEFEDVEDLLQKELEEDADMLSARENNYHFLRLVLERPSLHPREYERILYDSYGRMMGADLNAQLRANNLYSVGRRERLGRIMGEISLSTFNLLIGISAEPFEDYDTVAKIVRARDFWRRRIEGKAFLISLTNLPTWQDKVLNQTLLTVLNTLKAITREGSYKLCRETARRLIDVIGTEYGFEKRKTSTERVQEILEDVEVTRDMDDMRATLLIVQREFKRLRDEFNEEVENRTQEFVQDFFARMNSARYSYLLDTISQTEALIGQIEDSKWSVKPELQAIPMVIQVFTNFLRTYSVSPIEVVGTEKELLGAELSQYEFVGSVDIEVDDTVQVVVRTPGWKYKDTIISKPRVEEIASSPLRSEDSSRVSK